MMRSRLTHFKEIAPILLLSAPLYFYNALKWPMPKGFAGLYALFAEVLAHYQYRLLVDVPYYGPGGIPLVYPPLAIYLMAFITTQLRIAPLDYLRFAPAFFAWLCLIPFYLFTKDFVGSALKAVVATLLFSCAPAIFIMNVYAGGAIRALALLFTLFGLWFAYRSMEQGKSGLAFLAAVFFGLTALSHLGYVFFFALSLGVFTLIGPNFWQRFKLFAIILIVGLFIASPWWITIGFHYGFGIFRNALASHESLDFLTRLIHPLSLGWLWQPVAFAFFNAPVLGGLVFSGFIWALLNKQWRLPLWFFATLLFTSEGWHWIVLIGAILAGVFLCDLTSLVGSRISHISFRQAFLWSLIIVVLVGNGITSQSYITSGHPGISQDTIQLGDWFQSGTSAQAHYLYLSSIQDEAEWLPYFLRRTPALGFWGSEWLGAYDLQHRLTLVEVPNCLAAQSLTCVDELIDENNLTVDFLILPTGSLSVSILTELQNSQHWQNVYENSSYHVFSNEN
jgi:hypothetical protein